MNTFGGKLSKIAEELRRIRSASDARAAVQMPGGTCFLDGCDVLCLPRERGDSRYPYGQDGFNFWAYASGYMHCNEGLLSPFLRAAEGGEPNIAFFAGLPEGDGKFRVAPLLSVPVMMGTNGDDFERCTVLTPTAAYYLAESSALRFGLRVFVTAEREMAFSLQIENASGRPQSFFVSSFFNPYLRHQIYESGEDRWFKEVKALDPSPAQGDLGSFLVRVNEDKNREVSVTRHGIIRRHLDAGGGRLAAHEETTSRYQYVGGSRSSLHTPAALRRGTFGEARRVCTFTETAIAGDLLHLELPAGAVARLDVVFAFTDDFQRAGALAHGALCPEEIDAALEALQASDQARNGTLRMEAASAVNAALRPQVMNGFLLHLKKQVEFCALIKGYVQLSENSLIGIRDVFQAIEALAFWQPAAARRKMIEALGFTSPDGRCFRQYSLAAGAEGPGRMDLRPFIDQGAWVISCVTTYVRLTGDLDFLREPCGYHKIVDEAAGRVCPARLQDSVLEHLLKIMDYLLDHRDMERTRCVRAMYGDWNDALDGLGVSRDPRKAYGTGVSVMATLQVYQNALEMVELLETVNEGRHKIRAESYRQAAEDLADALRKYAIVEDESGDRRILHGWGDGRAYLVGSFSDPDGAARDGLTSNAFWVLSGLHAQDRSIEPVILDAFRRLDSRYGLRTFHPFFPENVRGVGRIGKLPPGTAENGAAYIHATAFAVMALFRMGRAREAWDQLVKILPFTDLHQALSHSPFVMPNSYGLNEEKLIDGECMNDWQTGSSNVVLKALIRFVFGIEPEMRGLWIQPAAWAPFEELRISLVVRGCPVSVLRRQQARGRRLFRVNGVERAGTHDDGLATERLWIPYDALTAEGIRIEIID